MQEFTYYDAHEPPFSLHGLVHEEGYCRVEHAMLPQLRPPVACLARQTAGGRIRFSTDATEISVEIGLSDNALKTHMTPLNMAGGEVYQGVGRHHRRVAHLRPKAVGDVPFEKLDGYALSKRIHQVIALSGQIETVTLYLPTFTGVEFVRIGLPRDTAPRPAQGYTIDSPILFYGSSITQGACAGRPSLIYPAQVARVLDADYWDLGFAGNALGEIELARYIANMKMSLFVMDYDHNAPDAQHLAATHEAFFQTVRDVQPTLPILMVSRPGVGRKENERLTCLEVILRTYQNALANHDAHVALLDGGGFFPSGNEDACLMDFVHPNDVGFAHIAQHILPEVKKLLRLE